MVTGTIAGHPSLSLDLLAHNVTKPLMDTSPYGSGQSIMIQAVSGDLVQLTITYVNNGNVIANTAQINLSPAGGLASLSAFTGNI